MKKPRETTNGKQINWITHDLYDLPATSHKKKYISNRQRKLSTHKKQNKETNYSLTWGIRTTLLSRLFLVSGLLELMSKINHWISKLSWLHARMNTPQQIGSSDRGLINHRLSKRRLQIDRNILIFLLNICFATSLFHKSQFVNIPSAALFTCKRVHRARISRASSGFLWTGLWLANNFYVTEIVWPLVFVDVTFPGGEKRQPEIRLLSQAIYWFNYESGFIYLISLIFIVICVCNSCSKESIFTPRLDWTVLLTWINYLKRHSKPV